MPVPHELARLYDEHAQVLFAFLLDLTGSEADSSDLVQEVFTRLAKRENLLEGIRSERGFLIKLAHNLAIDAVRHRETLSRKHEQLGEQPVELLAPSDPDAHSMQLVMDQAMNALPLEQRAVVHLKMWSELTFEEIAAALNISPNTAASRYRYGIEKIRTLLRPLYNEIQ